MAVLEIRITNHEMMLVNTGRNDVGFMFVGCKCGWWLTSTGSGSGRPSDRFVLNRFVLDAGGKYEERAEKLYKQRHKWWPQW